MSGDAVYTCLEAIFAVILGNLPESIAFLPKICYAVYERCSILKGAMGMKRMFAGLAAVLLLLGGCSGGDPDVQVYYTPESQSFESKFYPAAVPAEGGVLLRTLDRVAYNGEGTHPNNLYLWRGDSVAKYEPDGRLAGLIQLDGSYYYWQDWQESSVYRYTPETGASEPLFPLEEGEKVQCFWGHDGMLYAVTGYTFSGYDFYRYDLETGELYREDWLSDTGSFVVPYAAVGDELLLRSAEGCFWLDMRDGSRRDCGFKAQVCGYRDGAVALYQPGWEEIILHDVETCEETALPVPEEILSNEEPEDCTLLGVGEEAAYWLDDHTLYVQSGEGTEPVFAWYGPRSPAAWQSCQVIGGNCYFAFVGRPAEGYAVTDLAPYDPEQEAGKLMQFAAVTPEGEVYLLAKEYYDAIWDMG